MNICFLTNEYPNLRTGGIENVTLRLIYGLMKRGNRVCCISLAQRDVNAGDSFPHLCIAGTDGLNDEIVAFIIENDIQVVVNQAVEISLTHLSEQIKKRFHGIAVVKVLHSDPAYEILAVTDSESAFTTHRRFPGFMQRMSPIYWIRKFKRTKYVRQKFDSWLRIYDSIVVLSNSSKGDFVRFAGNRGEDKLHVIYNPVDIIDSRSSLQKEKVVVFVGRLVKEAKRPDRMLEVWRRIHYSFPDWRLYIVGDGPMRSELEDFCLRHNLDTVHFTGLTDPKPYYEKASIICLTSTSEGFSMVCVEGLSNGVVPIAFNSFGSLNEITQENVTAVWVKPYSLRDYAKKLTQLMHNSEFLARFCSNIRNDNTLSNKFSLEVILDEWEKLFKQLVKC